MAVDSMFPTVFRISENGDLIKWFDCSDRMKEPSDLAIHGNEYYICDFRVLTTISFFSFKNFKNKFYIFSTK